MIAVQVTCFECPIITWQGSGGIDAEFFFSDPEILPKKNSFWSQKNSPTAAALGRSGTWPHPGSVHFSNFASKGRGHFWIYGRVIFQSVEIAYKETKKIVQG